MARGMAGNGFAGTWKRDHCRKRGQEGWWRVALDGYAGTLTGKMKCSGRRIFQGGIERVEGEANASEIFSPDSN